MLVTVTNLTAAELTLGYPFNTTLDASGGASPSVTGGVSDADLRQGEDKGDPAYKRLNLLKQQGKISIFIEGDPNSSNLLDATGAVGSPSDPHLTITTSAGATAEVARYVAKSPGLLTSVSSVIAGALATGDATITVTKNGGASLGVITITQAASAAGDVDTLDLATPEPIAVGDVIELTVGGADTAGEKIECTLKIQPAA